ALFMARTKNVIRLVARLLRMPDGSPGTPADIVTAVNRELCTHNDDMMFVTLVFGILEPASGGVRFTNSGHNPPHPVNGPGVAAVTSSKGRPLGARANSTYETGLLQLGPGDILYLFTDGVTEATNRSEELYGEERLEMVLRSTQHRSAATIVAAVAEGVRA